MTYQHVTTPFGRRPISLGMLASQQLAGDIRPGEKRPKWKLFRAICEARSLLGVSDRALTVLDALLTFYPEDELSAENGLVVFPSNAQLSIRARGMAPATLRRHLAMLVETGLILRKDSPNGKRYARRGRSGKIDDAYGFSLAPLLSRAHEIEDLAAQIATDREILRATRERLTICRRDIGKLINLAASQGGDQVLDHDWEALHQSFRSLVDSIPRLAPVDELATILAKLEELRDHIVNRLKSLVEIEKTSAIESHSERHKQDSNTKIPIEFETASSCTELPSEPSAIPALATSQMDDNPQSSSEKSNQTSLPPMRARMHGLPLSLVLQACPQIADYGPQGAVSSWRDLSVAATVVRTMLNVTPSAYHRALTVMGPENTATLIACVLERAEHIKSAGGYIRDLTNRAEVGKFAIEPMLIALLRAGSSSDGTKSAEKRLSS
jgi:replication initiation protein RepC